MGAYREFLAFGDTLFYDEIRSLLPFHKLLDPNMTVMCLLMDQIHTTI